MKISRISYKRHFNMGDYNSEEIGCDIDIDAEEVKDPKFVERAYEYARRTVYMNSATGSKVLKDKTKKETNEPKK